MNVDRLAIVAVARDSLDGVGSRDEKILRRVFHPDCLIAQHFNDKLECHSLDSFIDCINDVADVAANSNCHSEILAVDITGDMALVKGTKDYKGVRHTEYLTMLKLYGAWVIMTMTSNSGEGI